MYRAVFVVYLISDAVILLASVAVMVQFSPSYNTAGRASVLYDCILVFYRVCCGLNIMYTIPVISKFYIICYRRLLPFHKISDFLSC